jgi:hypothetical protein
LLLDDLQAVLEGDGAPFLSGAAIRLKALVGLDVVVQLLEPLLCRAGQLSEWALEPRQRSAEDGDQRIPCVIAQLDCDWIAVIDHHDRARVCFDRHDPAATTTADWDRICRYDGHDPAATTTADWDRICCGGHDVATANRAAADDGFWLSCGADIRSFGVAGGSHNREERGEEEELGQSHFDAS